MPMNWPCSYILVCAGACVRNLPNSEFKTQLKTFPLDRPFHKPRLSMPVTMDYVHTLIRMGSAALAAALFYPSKVIVISRKGE